MKTSMIMTMGRRRRTRSRRREDEQEGDSEQDKRLNRRKRRAGRSKVRTWEPERVLGRARRVKDKEYRRVLLQMDSVQKKEKLRLPPTGYGWLPFPPYP
jgi:hypothetical protein